MRLFARVLALRTLPHLEAPGKEPRYHAENGPETG
jgi:hypothetical protein